MKAFSIDIVTPDGLEFSGEAESLLVKCEEGDVEILAGHADFLAAVSTGKARIRTDGTDRFAAVSGGFLTVNQGKAKLVATTFEFSEDIDLERAMRAKESAEQMLSSTKGELDERIIKAKLARALSRISVAQK